jgi:predicted cation transporter
MNSPIAWLKARAVELAAALCTAGVLIGGLALGVPFLRARIPETFLYSFCCVSAVLLRAVLDLAARGALLAVRQVRPANIVIPSLSRYPAGVVR